MWVFEMVMMPQLRAFMGGERGVLVLGICVERDRYVGI